MLAPAPLFGSGLSSGVFLLPNVSQRLVDVMDDSGAPACELGPVEDWEFKGEGNANVVYGYLGGRAPLVRSTY
jgi:hypothetical protein